MGESPSIGRAGRVGRANGVGGGRRAFRLAIRIAAAVAAGMLLALAIDVARAGGPTAWLARWGILPLYEARGRMVPVGASGRSVYLDCRGSGSPTVVFESGLGEGAGGWGYVLPETDAFTRACTWDRPGIGRSPQ